MEKGSTRGLRLKIRHVAGRTCFVSLPAHLTDELLDSHADALQAGAIAISWMGAPDEQEAAARGFAQVARSTLLSWAGGSSTQRDTLEVSPALASCLGLSEGLEVEMRLRKGLPVFSEATVEPVVSEATVEPVGSDDWEVVELHAGEIEDQLLNQVHIL
ncbi:hypothetical protein T484DRAFT_1828682 [Baffinella frigidus]|nr:hypothetical protein T484DRAFT_1828682 [Cryptophyta sp. CCMP2293]